MKLELRQGSRSRILAGVLLLIAGIFVLRLFYLQVIQHGHYTSLARQEQVDSRTLFAERGEIYLLNGSTPTKAVMNQTVYTVYIDPPTVSHKEETIRVLRDVAGGNVVRDFDKLFDRKESRYQVVAKRVTRVQAEKIKEFEVDGESLRGIGFQAVSQRVYPEGQLAGQVLGFVNDEGKGNYGLEGYLNEELAGKNGQLETVVDVSNVPLTVGDRNVRVPATDGKNVVLTIDRNIQSKVEQALAAGAERSGATHAGAVVMDPKTGRVLAMANVPTYNPGEYYKVEDISLFNNDVISIPYEPGSDIKTFTMAAAINEGVARATDTYNNTDRIQVEDRVIGNAVKGHTGVISFQTALNWSLNTGFVTLAQRLGNGTSITREARNTMYDYFHDRLRLGQVTGIELANEARGTVVSPDEVEGNAVRYSNMSFGQGMDTTVLQVTAGFSAIINGGDYYKPTVVAGEVLEDGSFKKNDPPVPLQSGVVSKSTSDQMLEMTHIARKSGFPSIDKPGYYVGGKTGTSQVSVNGRYSTTETIGTYLGFGGSEKDPQYVIMVSISGKDKLMAGAADAMPIFTDISNWMLDYLKIQPKG